MDLPEMAPEKRADFLRQEIAKAIGLYWHEFTFSRPDVRARWLDAVQSSDVERIVNWCEQDVLNDPRSSEHSEQALGVLRKNFASIMQQDAEDYLRHSSHFSHAA